MVQMVIEYAFCGAVSLGDPFMLRIRSYFRLSRIR